MDINPYQSPDTSDQPPSEPETKVEKNYLGLIGFVLVLPYYIAGPIIVRPNGPNLFGTVVLASPFILGAAASFYGLFFRPRFFALLGVYLFLQTCFDWRW